MLNILIEKHSQRQHVFSIFVDEEHWRDIHTHIFGKKPALKPTEDLAELENQFLTLEYKGAFNYTLRRLTLKNQPSAEVRQALTERLVSALTIEQVISKCQALGYLNDAEWMAAFIRQQQAKHVGKQVIIQKLRFKGLSEEEYAPVLHAAQQGGSERDHIQKLLQTRYKSRNLHDYKEKQKVIAALVRRGFPLPAIHSVIDI